MSDYIPGEVLEKILLFLPAKSLVRFCCLSKSWKSLITSSDFIHTHLNRTRISTHNNGDNLLLLKYNVGEPECEQYSLHFDNDHLVRYENLDCPFHTSSDQYFLVLGSVNGLICLSVDLQGKTNHYILWNPSIRNYITLPAPQFTFHYNGPYDDAVGFGYDSRNHDYKVVRLVFYQCEEDMSPRVEIFKLSTGSWETISATIDTCYWIQDDIHDPVFLNGAVHWNAYSQRIDHSVILSFDMRDEVFDEIMLPSCYDEPYSAKSMDLAICGEWISLICDDWNSTEVIIWVMKQYGVGESWTKLHTFDFEWVMWKTVGFKKNGDILGEMNNGELVSYDANIQHITNLGISEFKARDYRGSRFYVGTYDTSLVLLGYGNIPGQDLNVEM